MAKAKDSVTEIDILQVNRGEVTFLILGTTPLICNRMSQKAMRQLLFPSGRKTAADKASSLKHNPMEEFRASPYTDSDEDSPTLIQHLSTAFKKAMMGAALDLPGSSKAQIGRLAWVRGEKVAIYGVPQMFMSVVRSADMNKTPDIRTRAIIPKWACQVTVAYAVPLLKQQNVVALMASGGMTQGVGDWRAEKGSGTFGSFELVDSGDERWKAIVKTGGRKAQVAAMANPDFYDDETAELYSWFTSEHKKRAPEVVSKGKNGAAHASA